MKSIIDSFLAFNQNAFSYLTFTITNNLWYLLIAAGVIACIVLYLREEVAVTVREEQQVI